MNYSSSNDAFNKLWSEKGIYAIAFAGHGSTYGFVADPSSDTAIGPHAVTPPYHLAAVMSYSCYSAAAIPGGVMLRDGSVPTHSWKEHVSAKGKYFGYKGMVTWLNEQSQTETSNGGNEE